METVCLFGAFWDHIQLRGTVAWQVTALVLGVLAVVTIGVLYVKESARLGPAPRAEADRGRVERADPLAARLLPAPGAASPAGSVHVPRAPQRPLRGQHRLAQVAARHRAEHGAGRVGVRTAQPRRRGRPGVG